MVKSLKLSKDFPCCLDRLSRKSLNRESDRAKMMCNGQNAGVDDQKCQLVTLQIGIIVTSIVNDNMVNKAKFANLKGLHEDDLTVLIFLQSGVVKPRLTYPMKRMRFGQALIWLRRQATIAPTTAEQCQQTAFVPLDPSGT
ncbi:hypothetical protein AXG93_4805s1060 [Marchantia polymorpha subsp. ruderalis]|uniref:Uncharacterized protein n=1 Tax=Marchantia polymorpha subsp. ruderalis TaxID=1480154 RepID=A0A176VGL3_MARPO|nr:hypothetical protein AXG93_4805s1060 [Marchantia polymorpha subsp. ruderalis]